MSPLPHSVKCSISRAPIVQEIIQSKDEEPIIPHVLFQSPKQRGDLEVTPELIWDAGQLEPYDRLPRELIQTRRFYYPNRPGDWVPPRFHYGWRPNVDRLLAFARERGITVTYADATPRIPAHNNPPHGLRPRSAFHDYLNDVYVDEHGNTVLVPHPETKALWPDADGPEPNLSAVDIFNIISRALSSMVFELAEARGILDWNSWSIYIVNTLRADRGNNFLVSLMTSGWDLMGDADEGRCTPEEIDILASAQGVSGPPRWYVDRDAFEWCDQYKEALLFGLTVVDDEGDSEWKAKGDDSDEDEEESDVDDEDEDIDELF